MDNQAAMQIPKTIFVQDGNLRKEYEDHTEEFDFNAEYEHFYPRCIFTAFTYYRKAFYVAGIDEMQKPHLFSSCTGNVWNEEVIVPYFNRDLSVSYGPIVAIVSNKKEEQLILLCKNGYAATLSGCPKCVKAKYFDKIFLSADCIDDTLQITCEDNAILEIPFAMFLQYRTSWTYAKQHLEQGACLIDLREEDAAPELPGAKYYRAGEALRYLKTFPKEQYVFLFCQTGGQADALTEYARYSGYINVFSLGGIEQLLEKNEGIWPV